MQTNRFEMLRALACIADSLVLPNNSLTNALGLEEIDPGEHTETFILSCPPYASIHLGAEGKLGGEALDRVAGFWRAIGLTPPNEPDHLSVLLSLYAELGEAESNANQERTVHQLKRVRETLLWEHLWSWVPGYLGAVIDLETITLTPWANLLAEALYAETRSASPAQALPLAMRQAVEPLNTDSTDNLLDSIIAPIRSGIILTRNGLRDAGSRLGIGCRVGERRFTLRSMLEQDPHSTVSWLRDESLRWARRHSERPKVLGGDPRIWWTDRALVSASTLEELLSNTRTLLPAN